MGIVSGEGGRSWFDDRTKTGGQQNGGRGRTWVPDGNTGLPTLLMYPGATLSPDFCSINNSSPFCCMLACSITQPCPTLCDPYGL